MMFFKKEKNLNYWIAIVFLSISFLVLASLNESLIEKGKLDQSWENKLSQVDVFKRGTDDKNEIVVSFQRASGDPKTVYIFLSAAGKYAGSNFTGE